MKSSIKILLVVTIIPLCALCLADCPPADLTNNCFVDFQDLGVLISSWLNDCNEPSWCAMLDLNHSGRVNIVDYSLLAGQWLTTDPCAPNDMIFIPAGIFQMGDSFAEGNLDELPVHTVALSWFFIGKYEITNQQYCDFLNNAKQQGLIGVSDGVVYQAATTYPYCSTSISSASSQIAYDGSTFTVRTKGSRNMSSDPMVTVSWYGAAAYCNWRSQQEGREECYNLSTWICDFTKKGYHLPTEAQWEYAARGGLSSKRFPWADPNIAHGLANYESSTDYSYDISPTRGYHPAWNDGIYPYTSPVGSFLANGYGVHDMAGNVWEWCNDWYSTTYYDASPSANPTGPASGSYRVLRGGSWFYGANYCCVAARDFYFPDYRFFYNGFRAVLNLN